MTPRTLKSRTVLFFTGLILAFGAAAGFLVVYIINTQVVARAQRQADHDLQAARKIFNNEIADMEKGFTLLGCRLDVPEVREAMGLDYLYLLENGKENLSPAVRRARAGTAAGGARLIGRDEYRALLGATAHEPLAVRTTPKAGPVKRRNLSEVMALEYARPCYDGQGNMDGVLVGGKVINRHPDFVERIHGLVYENRTYRGKPTGTVTVFQDDVRISTNVLDTEGQRAIGTRVSAEVYENVVGKGLPWRDRAFVVTDWYLTAYEPIRDIDGDIIGILYVGLLEKPFAALRNRSIAVVLCILAGITGLAVLLSFGLAKSILRPVERLRLATARMADGDLAQQVVTHTSFKEMTDLAGAFNRMAGKLESREKRLDDLNKSYLDLIGFVTHELKGILATTILNAYMVRDGYLGIINFKQRRALDAVARNLDYFDATVKNFLNLSRLEKNEMTVSPVPVRLRADIFGMALDSFAGRLEEKTMEVVDRLPEAAEIAADPTLLQIVANNLVDNAVKYGTPGGRLILDARFTESMAEVEVYNDGPVIPDEAAARLFDKFYRVTRAGARKVQGTGLGLHITREIITRHGGTIRVVPREKGNSFIFTLQRSVQHGNAA